METKETEKVITLKSNSVDFSLIEQGKDLNLKIKKLTTELEGIKAKFKSKFKGFTNVVFNYGNKKIAEIITIEAGLTFDKEKFEQENPSLYEKYCTKETKGQIRVYFK